MFANVHVDSENQEWTHAPRQIANLLYHPGSTRDWMNAFDGIHDCFSGIHRSTGQAAESVGEEAFVLLTPEGVPPLPWGGGKPYDYLNGAGPDEKVGMLTALVCWLAERARRSKIYRRIVLVGWERWPDGWLDRRLTYRGDEIHEEGTADLPSRIMWWLDALLKPSGKDVPTVAFMTHAEFADEIDDAELLPHILSSYGEQRPEGAVRGEGRAWWGDFPGRIADPPVLWEESVWDAVVPKA
jgi:hypothetical protein